MGAISKLNATDQYDERGILKPEYALTSAEFFADTIDSLAELSRQAENMYLEELNGRDTGWHVTSDELKTSIMWFVQNYLDMDEQEEYEDLCNSMGI